ncbi:MAG: hypothetical protein ACTHNS_08075 [Marmoricola sp.]
MPPPPPTDPDPRGPADEPEQPLAEAQRLAPLRTAAALVAVEGLLCGVFGVIEIASHHPEGATIGIGGGAFFLAYGAALVWCAWGMHRLRPWSRSPVLLSQLILLGLAWNVRTSSPAIASIALVVAVVVLAGTLHPRSIDALNREEHRRPGA